MLLEYVNGSLESRYTQGPGTDEHLAKTNLTTGANYFYHTDALGSTTEITDSTGSIIESYQYTSFGQPTVFDKDGLKITQSFIGNIYQYTGREYDIETGQQYSRERYYDSSLQRFLSKDPIGFAGGINIYAYVRNNPINATDPFGLLGEDKVKEKLDEYISDQLTESEKQKAADFTGQQIKPWHIPGLLGGNKEAYEKLEERVRKALEKSDKETKDLFDRIDKIKKELEEQQKKQKEPCKT
ncbi:MAG: hypothetical protein HYZ66_09440 [Chlamydiae bacterium]|nr:hypothetical protein [Chlamydiota bacterium]